MKKIAMLSMMVILGIFFFSVECTASDEVIYRGTISGRKGGTIVAGTLAITFPSGIANMDIGISIAKKNNLPAISGTRKQMEAYKAFKFIGSAYKVSATPKQFNKPFMITINFDPSELDNLKEDEIPIMILVSDEGKLEFPEVFFPNLANGLITVKSSHFSSVAFTAAPHQAIMAFAPAAQATDSVSISDSEFKSKTQAYEKAHPPAPAQETITQSKLDEIGKDYIKAKNAYYAALKSGNTTNIDKLYEAYKKLYDIYVNATQKKVEN